MLVMLQVLGFTGCVLLGLLADAEVTGWLDLRVAEVGSAPAPAGVPAPAADGAGLVVDRLATFSPRPVPERRRRPPA